ncbi:MAG: HAD family hydrolase [Alphaproteobacteria bacterium]|nr:HAD family hydrolase [Alphaproteobacteria bacterium]
MPKAIIFDWDQTLAHTKSAILQSIEHTLKKYNKEPWKITKRKYQDITKSLKDNFPNYFGTAAKEAYKDYLQHYEKYSYNLVRPMEQAIIFLHLCQQKNIELHIASSKEKSLLIKEIKLCYPDIKFLNILGHNDAKQNKPAPDPILKILENANYPINFENVWMIGDSQQDTDCAYNAHIQPILLGKGNLMTKNYIQQHQNSIPPLLVFTDFKEITLYLNQTDNKK